MSRVAQRRLGWKEYGACAVILVLILLFYTAQLQTGKETTEMYRETTFIRSSSAREEGSTGKMDSSETMSKSEGAAAAERLEIQESPATETTSDEERAVTSGHETAQEEWGNIEEVSADAPASVENPTRSEEHTEIAQKATDTKQEKRTENSDQSLSYSNAFVSGANSTSASFHLFSPESVYRANDEICAQCPDSDCNLGCQKYQELLSHLNGTSVESGDARLHVIPVDPLSWFRKTEGNTTQYRALLTEMVRSVKSAYAYRTFKGSDHVFVCLDGDGCVEFANDLSKTLTEGLGSRAIFAAKGARGSSSLQWPCPLRVIDLDREGVDDVTADVDHIVQRASIMIDRRNRWICADKDHPAVHWERMMKVDASGVVMKQYGFVICAIPKSGSTMTKVLMRRMSGYKDWNQTGTGINQSPRRSGLQFAGNLNYKEKKAIAHDQKFVRGVIVRHPISRLLSGYLDKIFQKHQYHRVPGVQACMKGLKIKIPPFHKFVHCLTKLHPNPDKLDQHFRIQSAFCNFRRSELDFVGKQGHLLPEMKEFGTSLNFWEEYGADGWGDGHHAFGEKSYQTRTHDSANQIWQYYTEDLMMKAYHYYKEDFDRFGYTVKEILATKPDHLHSKR